MCPRLEAAKQVHQCAEQLLRACVPLHKVYDSTTQEKPPEDMQALLDKLK